MTKTNKLLKLMVLSVSFAMFASCSNDSVAPSISNPDGKGFTLTVNMPGSNMPGSRISIDKSESGRGLIPKWESGDKIQLCYDQGRIRKTETVAVKNIDGAGNASFDLNPPEGINVEEPFDIYGIYGNCRIDTEKENIVIKWDKNNNNTLNSIHKDKNMILTFKAKDVSENNRHVHAGFKHTGSFLCVKIKNTSNKSITATGVKLYGNAAGKCWVCDGGGYNVTGNVVIAPDNVDCSKIIDMSAGVVKTYAPGKIMEFWAWHCINPEVQPDLDMELYNGATLIKKVFSIKPCVRKMEAGKAYHVYATWNGNDLDYTDPDFALPTISFVVAEPGGAVEFMMYAAPEDQDSVWIDINNNGIKDDADLFGYKGKGISNCDERIKAHGINFSEYNAAVQKPNRFALASGIDTATIHGKITYLNCTGNEKISSGGPDYVNGCKITELDVTKNTALTHLNCSQNELKTLNLTKNTALIWLTCSGNNLETLNLTKNTKLIRLKCDNNKLKTIDLSKNIELNELRCYYNQIEGANMTNLVNFLRTCPIGNKGNFFVTKDKAHVLPLKNNGSKIAKSDIKTAEAKNWNVY